MKSFCGNRIIGSTEIRSKKKSIKRHNRLVKKEIDTKKFRRRHSGGWRGRFVYDNNFLCALKRAFGDDVVRSEFTSSTIHELKVEFAMEKPADSVKYLIPQYVSEEQDT